MLVELSYGVLLQLNNNSALALTLVLLLSVGLLSLLLALGLLCSFLLLR